MCEQTEIDYLDGDVVWVKLGACWWPGQVRGFQNLPEDIQREFQKKPLIAAVKFFQEDTYEFVKNYQLIYKYNCTLKDEFIRKGLDKYRSKSKDGSRYMDKFPGDVEMAEKLTGGDPDILNHEKFCPEEKPNISALFGDKKLSKKKRDREDSHRKSDGMDGARKITHPRFVKESDHEVRIRQQPSSLPSTPNNTGSPQYPCHLCNFTSSRVNVIICHIKSHRSGDALPSKSKVKSYTQYRNRYSDGDTPKRKYVRKEKSESSRTKNKSESGKRKQSKQTEKAAKKKKTSDPKIRDTILADWDDESEEDVSLNQSKSSELSPANSTANKSQFDFEKLDQSSEKNNSITDTSEIIAETEKFLKETEKLTSINIIDNCLQGTGDAAKSFKTNAVDQRRVSEKDDRTSDTESNEFVNKPQTEKDSFNDVKGSKFITSDKSDKKSLLSCFDFHEEEPSIPPVRKKSRAFNQKKEIIKEFEMSQALKTEQEKEIENKKVKDDTNLNTSSIDKDLENDEKSAKIVDDYKSSKNETIEEKEQDKSTKISENVKKSNSCETQFEIVEIFEVERVEVGNEKNTKDSEAMDIETSVIETIGLNTKESSEEKEIRVRSNSTKDEQVDFEDERVNENTKCMEHPLTKESEETISGRFIDDTEEETVSESAETLPEQSENSDVDMFDQDQVPNVNVSNVSLKSDQSNSSSLIHKRRGRPKKSFHSGTSGSISGSESPRIKESKSSTKLFEKFEMDRRLSESEGERSQHSGRKRKPNKKYLESDIYVHDLDQKMYRTDDSQSENEEKGSERIKSKLKRNRKSTESEKKSSEDADLRDATEISFNLISKSEHNANSKNVESKDRLSDKTSKQQTSTIFECQTSVEAFEKLHALTLQDKTMSKQFETFIFEDKKSSAEEESATKSEDIVIRCEDTKDADNDNTQTKSKHQQADLKSGESINTLQIDSSFDKEPSQQSEASKTVDMLPPKKSQIKKFELSQIDLFNSDAITEKISTDSKSQTARETLEDLNAEMEAENNPEAVDTSKEKENVVSKKVEVDTAAVTSKIETQKSKNLEDEEEIMSVDQVGQEVEINILEDQNCKSENNEAQKKSIGPTKHKLKSTSEFGTKSKKDKELFPDESANTFQEAFLKTLDMDKKKDEVDESDSLGKGKKSKKIEKKKSEESENVDVSTGISQTSSVTKEKSDISNFPKSIQDNSPDVVATTNVESMEIDDKDHKIDGKIENTVVQDLDQLGSSSSESNIASKSFGQSSTSEDVSKPLDIDVQKVDESSRMSTSTLSPSSDVGVPVKKREMPRIIENVTLTEPMQILKSKLLDKLPPKGVKHKLDAMSAKKGDPKSSAKPKVMKIESLSLNTKMKTGSKVTSPHLSLTKKLQVLKAEEAETAAMIEAQNEQINVKTSKTQSTTSTSEKYIQQSSQSLADMELDINSMPFVLSEDVLTPENIEQMPVVITSIIPTSSTVSATLSLTPTTQMVSSTQTQFKLNENTNEVSPTKKKSGTPAILKNKAKAKPTITSIKTIVPPLTGGVKGIKFQSAPATSKVQPLLAQKGTSGKYVVVQTSGGQQLRYSVQGKGIQQKIAVPTGKSTGTAQVVQQGGKVVILTSAQASQSKVLPMNISKTLTGKVQRIMTSKGQVFCPISPQGIINSKTVIAPKGDGVSPTTSKLPAGHKIINTQGIIASKGVLTPISGAIGKTALLSTLSQGILTKGGIYTPISASTLSGKTIIGSKALVTKGATILSSQNLGSSKAILTPISQAVAGKTILGSPGIVSTKATVLTPITGQQVKAIAAKSPSKGTKVQYQSVQQKVQLPMVQKSQKATATSQGRSGQLKTASSAVVLQNTIPTQKSLQQGKKIAKQTIVQGSSLQTLTPQGTMQQTVGVNTHGQQKGKVMSSSTIQKVIIPRGNRHTKTQQKIVVQKVQEHSTSAPNIQTKQSIAASTVANVPKAVVQQKPTAGTPATTKPHTKGQTINKSTTQQQKNLSNVTMNSASASNLNTNLSTSLPLAPQERIEADKKSKIENILEEPVPKEQPKLEKFNAEKGGEVEKVEEPKIATQPQIMALPTESSDGTQTYVLVTIDEQGQIQPLDNNTLMSLEGTTQNPDGTRTLYIDPSSLGEAGTLDNIVLQFDNGALPSIQTTATEPTQTIISESFPATDVIQSSNQDILAAALANTGFQQEISLADNATGNVVTTGLTQTSLINQTILQSTIIPPTEPISSPSVLETSLTLNQPIMTPLEVPSNLPMPSESPSTSTVATIPSSLELPITITNPNISYISTGEAQIQIPGNSMPDIGEIMETPSSAEIAQTEMPASTQYLVLPNLEENITVDSQNVQSTTISMPTVSYSVSIPNNMVLQSSQVQTTPSMPIIDDTYAENVQFPTTVEQSIATEASFVDVPVSEMLISKSVSRETEKSQDVTVTSEMIVSTEDSTPQESIVSTNEYSGSKVEEDAVMSLEESYSSQEESAKPDEVTLKSTIGKDNSNSNVVTEKENEDLSNNDNIVHMKIAEQPDDPMTSNMHVMDENNLVSSESTVKMSPVQDASFEVSDSNEVDENVSQESKNIEKLKELNFNEESNSKVHSPVSEVQASTSNEVEVAQDSTEVLPAADTLDRMDEQSMDIDETVESKESKSRFSCLEDNQGDEPSSQAESDSVQRNMELNFDESNTENSQETPSQSYEQFNIAVTTDSTDTPSQSATKSENSREPTQSITYEPMETDEEVITTEPPTQSFEHSKMNEASQSYEVCAEANTNAPTQSFNELMQSQEERVIDETIDDQTFPTQSYEIDKTESIPETLETDAEISQEGNMPSQSNDIGTDGIGTSSVSTNNSGLNEDETASSSYVPETPENQERDPDQESAISTSSCEIPPCAELNIASSSAEHTSIHDNGVPEIPTSSYNLNPDITSTHVDSVPTSSYEEQNVSTSYEVPISMPGLEETPSQNFVTESTDHRNEPSSYYAHHQEVTPSYYESVEEETNPRLNEDTQGEVTPSYYDGTTQEASQSYFNPEEATPSYSSHTVSPSYYKHRPETEASQSYYSTDDIDKSEEQSSSQNIEASQSFYQEQPDEIKLTQQGEATPTYTERYPVDYTLDNSPIERHDLVESSVPATRPTER